MTRAALLFLAACGRIGFEPQASIDSSLDGELATDAFVARPELVQARGLRLGGPSTMAIGLAPTRAGSLLVVGTLNFNINAIAEPTVSITDDAGNTYVSANCRALWTGDDGAVEIWYASNARAGATTVTINSAGPTSRSTWVLEFANMDPSAPVDDVGTFNDAPGGGTVAGPSVSPSRPFAVIVSVILISGVVTQVSPGDEFINLEIINGDAAAYVITDRLGTYAASWDAPGSDNNSSSTAAFLGLPAD